MKEDFVGYDIAVKLKEKGFKDLCLAYYTNTNDLYFNYSHKAGAKYSDCYLSHNLMPKNSVSGKFVDAPTISQVLKWLRKQKGIHISTSLYGNEDGKKWNHAILDIETKALLNPKLEKNYSTCVESDLAGIEYVLDNLI